MIGRTFCSWVLCTQGKARPQGNGTRDNFMTPNRLRGRIGWDGVIKE